MADIILAGSTSGSITVSAPAVSGTNTLTLPVATDTLVGLATTDTLTNKTLTSPVLTTPNLGTPSTLVLTNATGLAAASLPAGSVLQVVQGTLLLPVVTTANNVDIGLSATITPSSSANKILILVTISVGGNGSSYDAGLALMRGSTDIGVPSDYGSRIPTFMPYNQRNQSPNETASVSGNFLDSPSSTAAVTYKIQARSSNSMSQFINRSSADENNSNDHRNISTITLMEIKG